MTVLDIVVMGHPALRTVAQPVADPTAPEVRAIADDMRDTLTAIDGIGLAAPQVQVPWRIVVYRLPAGRIPAGARQQPIPWTVMVNPVVTPVGDERGRILERCLSLPGLYGRVPRFVHVELAYTTLDGAPVRQEARGYHAMLLQHECDHLDGVLYPMRMDDLSALTDASELPPELAARRYTAAEFDGDVLIG